MKTVNKGRDSFFYLLLSLFASLPLPLSAEYQKTHPEGTGKQTICIMLCLIRSGDKAVRKVKATHQRATRYPLPSCRRRRADADAAKELCIPSLSPARQSIRRARENRPSSGADVKAMSTRHQEAPSEFANNGHGPMQLVLCVIYSTPRCFLCAGFVFTCESKEVGKKRGTGSDWLRQSPLFPCVVSTTG